MKMHALSMLTLTAAAGAVFAATSTYVVLCKEGSCEAEMTTTVDTSLSVTESNITVLVGGYAQSAVEGGDTATFDTESRLFTVADVVARVRTTATYENIASHPPVVATQCFCDMDSAPCGPAGVQEVSRSKVSLVWYSAATSDIGCPTAGNSRLCTRVTYAAKSTSIVYDIGDQVSTIQVANKTLSNNTTGPITFAAPTSDLHAASPTRTTPFATVQLTSTGLDQTLSHYHYIKQEDGGFSRSFVRASDGSLAGALWWTCEIGGVCTIPPISTFASLFETGDYSTCNGDVPSILPTTDGVPTSEAISGVSVAGSHLSFTPYTGFTSVRIKETRKTPFPVVHVDRIDCIRTSSGKVVQMTTTTPTYGYSVLRPSSGDGMYIPVKLSGRVSVFIPPSEVTSYKANHGSASKMCTWPDARVLRVTPLDQYGVPLAAAAAAASYIPPVPGSDEVSLAGVYSASIAALVLACLAFFVSAFTWRRHQTVAWIKRAVRPWSWCKRQATVESARSGARDFIV